MRYLLLALLLFPAPLFAQPQPADIAPSDPLTPAQELATFKVPAGFEVQMVSCEPMIGKPIQMAFDAKGRLWVTTSNEYPFPAMGREGHDKLYILEDFGPDGRARKISTFADDLNIPIGILPLPDCNSCIVYSLPNIWKLTDTKGTGKADKKEILFGPFGHRDTHGMVNSLINGLDGWIYAHHGYSNDSTIVGKDGQELKMNSGNVFRFRPDGSHLEIWSRGQVNPFGMTIDPYGQLYNADCHSRPITQLIHKAVYTSFSKPHDGLGFAPSMIRHGHGSTALCGLTWLQTETFPAEYQNDIFLGNVVTNRVHRDKLVWHGSSPDAVEQPEFMTTTDQWFRPVDIKLGLDGALYVADFYNKIIGHYEVPLTHPARDHDRGRIWRVVYKDKPLMDKTDLTKLSFDDLVKELDSSNIVRRYSAAHQLIERMPKEKEKFSTLVQSWLRSEKRPALAPWLAKAWTAFDHLNEDSLFPQKPGNDEIYRTHLWRTQVYWDAKEGKNKRIPINLNLLEMLKKPRELRAVLETYCIVPNPEQTNALVQLIAAIPADDPQLRHEARVTLREHLLLPESWKSIPELNSDAQIAIISDVCLGTPNAQAAAYLLKHLEAGKLDRARLPDFLQQIVRYGDEAILADFQAVAFKSAGDDLTLKVKSVQAILKGLQQRGKFIGPEWNQPCQQLFQECLKSKDAQLQTAALEIAGALKLTDSIGEIAVFANGNSTIAPKIAAIQTLAQIDAKKAISTIAEVIANDKQPLAIREKCAQTLAQINSPAARAVLGEAIKTAPSRLDSAIAQALSGSKEGGELLLTTVELGKASPRLLQDRVVLSRLELQNPKNYKARVDKLTAGLPSFDQKVQQLIADRKKSQGTGSVNVDAGKLLYTKNCAICHQIAGQGAKIGPNLDGIGTRGLDRLLEDVLDPNKNVDLAFRQTTLYLKDGKTLSGLVTREEGESVVIADQTGKESSIPKADIEERKVSNLSPMPANFGEQISEDDFRNLMGYLLKQRKD